MTSKLVVNTIEADTCISSVSFASSISMNSTAKFHFSAAGIDIGADTNINRPESGVLGFNINSSEKVRINSSGQLSVTRTGTDVLKITSTNAGDTGANLLLHHNSASPADNDIIGVLSFRGEDDSGAETTFSELRVISTDVSNNSESGDITFHNRNAGSFGERLRITSAGKVGMGLVDAGGTGCDPDGNHLLIRGASTFQTNKGHIMLTGDSATVGQGPQIVFSESGGGSNNAGAYIGHVRQGSNSIGDLVFGTRATSGDASTVPDERLRITSSGTVNIGDSSTQTTHLLYLQSTGDAGIHIRADTDNSGENDNPYLSMSQDGSNNQELKIGQNGDVGQNFPTSFANAPFIHANHSAAYPLQLAHMDTMCVFISNRKNELGLNDYSGNSVAGMEIHHRGNDTGAALKFSGHNNTGTPGVKTFTQLTHLGGDAKFMIHHMGDTAIQIGSTRRIDLPAVYGTAISSPMRDLHIESTGQMGYNPSVRASKINIADNNDVSWLYNLAPKTYNKRKRVSKDTNEWTNEAESDLQYGLIAEEVESVNSNICFYDVDESNNKTLAGVTYSQLITPILKAVQDLKSEINILQEENFALRIRLTNLEDK